VATGNRLRNPGRNGTRLAACGPARASSPATGAGPARSAGAHPFGIAGRVRNHRGRPGARLHGRSARPLDELGSRPANPGSGPAWPRCPARSFGPARRRRRPPLPAPATCLPVEGQLLTGTGRSPTPASMPAA
jgi:hypothetical protein